jgi:hypothetical protein
VAEVPKGQSIINYPTVGSAGRLRILHQSKDYLKHNEDITESKLNYGIVMHEILMQIKVPSDQEKAVRQMLDRELSTARMLTLSMLSLKSFGKFREWHNGFYLICRC